MRLEWSEVSACLSHNWTQIFWHMLYMRRNPYTYFVRRLCSSPQWIQTLIDGSPDPIFNVACRWEFVQHGTLRSVRGNLGAGGAHFGGCAPKFSTPAAPALAIPSGAQEVWDGDPGSHPHWQITHTGREGATANPTNHGHDPVLYPCHGHDHPGGVVLQHQQAKAKEGTMAKLEHMLNYLAMHPVTTICLHASNMILNIHSNPSYLSEPMGKSHTANHFFLGWLPRDSTPIHLNDAFFTLFTI